MISLSLDGRTLPLVFLADTYSLLTVRVDGQEPAFSSWSVYTLSGVEANGTGDVDFNPRTAVTHYIHVSAQGQDGKGQVKVFSVQVAARRTVPVEVGVQWDSVAYSEGERVRARILFRDPEGLRYELLSWRLYRNNVFVSEGIGPQVEHREARYGAYRLQVSATDCFGMTVRADSSVHVRGDFEIQSAIVPIQPNTRRGLCLPPGAVSTPAEEFESVTGVGLFTMSPYAMSGAGAVVPPVVGPGAFTMSPYRMAGTGEVTPLVPSMGGAAAFTMSPYTMAGSGLSVVVIPTGTPDPVAPGGYQYESVSPTLTLNWNQFTSLEKKLATFHDPTVGDVSPTIFYNMLRAGLDYLGANPIPENSTNFRWYWYKASLNVGGSNPETRGGWLADFYTYGDTSGFPIGGEMWVLQYDYFKPV